MESHAGHGTSPARDVEGRLSTSPKRGVCDPNETVAFGTSSPEAPWGGDCHLTPAPARLRERLSYQK